MQHLVMCHDLVDSTRVTSTKLRPAILRHSCGRAATALLLVVIAAFVARPVFAVERYTGEGNSIEQQIRAALVSRSESRWDPDALDELTGALAPMVTGARQELIDGVMRGLRDEAILPAIEPWVHPIHKPLMIEKYRHRVREYLTYGPIDDAGRKACLTQAQALLSQVSGDLRMRFPEHVEHIDSAIRNVEQRIAASVACPFRRSYASPLSPTDAKAATEYARNALAEFSKSMEQAMARDVSFERELLLLLQRSLAAHRLSRDRPELERSPEYRAARAAYVDRRSEIDEYESDQRFHGLIAQAKHEVLVNEFDATPEDMKSVFNRTLAISGLFDRGSDDKADQATPVASGAAPASVSRSPEQVLEQHPSDGVWPGWSTGIVAGLLVMPAVGLILLYVLRRNPLRRATAGVESLRDRHSASP
jgi:hypothetical protein